MTIRKSGYVALAVLAASTMAASAEAVPVLTLSFTDPVETVSTTDSIPIFVTATLAAGSQTVANYLSASYSSALVQTFRGALTSAGMNVNQPVTFSLVGSFLGCSTFAPCSGSSPYSFTNTFSSVPWADLTAGGSITFQIGTLTPVDGVAPEGDYTLSGITYRLVAQGVSATNQPVTVNNLSGQGTSWSTSGGAFTRTVEAPAVAAVPEPASWALMITGFGLAGVGLRRSRKVVAALA